MIKIFSYYSNTISLEFDNEAGDLTDGYVFCDLLCKLIYENFHGFSYKKAESDDDYNLFCKCKLNIEENNEYLIKYLNYKY